MVKLYEWTIIYLNFRKYALIPAYDDSGIQIRSTTGTDHLTSQFCGKYEKFQKNKNQSSEKLYSNLWNVVSNVVA